MISVVIVNLNQDKKLEQCLKSVIDFASEILVLDLGSTDSSKEVSRKYHATFLSHELVPYVEMVRNYSILKTNGDWVLILDPDEMLSLKLKVKLNEIMKVNKFAAVNIPRKNIFFGKWIRHTNWWPDRHIRFFKKGKVIWEDKIHAYPRVTGRIINLEAQEELAIIHHGYESIHQFFNRQNRYSNIEAWNKYEVGQRFSLFKLIWWPAREFLIRFIKHKGFMDGFYGFALTFLMMIYKLSVVIKLWETKNNKK